MVLTELHLALIGLALALLLALYLYNKWQERRALRELSEQLHAGVGDALLQTPAIARPVVPAPPPQMRPQEPVLRTAVVATAAVTQRVEPRLDESMAPIETAEPPAPPATAVELAAPADEGAATGGWIEDPLLDCALELRCAHAVDGVAVFDAAAALAHWDAPLAVFLVAWDPRLQQWVQPDRFGFYSDLLVAIQLANRKCALDEILASRFVAAVQQVAMALDADFDPPEIKRLVEQAAELDRLCARFDVQIGMTLEPVGEPWDAVSLARAATQAGLVADGEHRWCGVDATGRALFALSSTPPAGRLALELDVPLAPAEAEPLQRMFGAASNLAATLGASVVDDNKRPITAGSLAAIGEQLQALYRDMRNAGIEPGGMRAQRLYS